MVIPKVFHQLWKSHDIPARYAPFRESWLPRNPGWTMRLWTDGDLAELVETRYPELVGLYRGYARPISRADLGRYLVLETFGGVYADLDCECLKPLGPLLEGASLLIGVEPDEHAREPLIRARGLTQIVCPSFIASIPGHPFWRDVRARVVAAAAETAVVDQTGPFLLTRVFEASETGADVTLAPASQTYPFTKAQCWSGKVFELETWERETRDAFVAHYWDSSWWRKPTPLDGLPWMIPVGFSASSAPPPSLPSVPEATMISCVTVAAGTAGLDLALECFRRQTHANSELIVLCADLDGPAARIAKGAGRSDIKVIAAPAIDEAGLLAHGAEHAAGHVICRWDAGQLHDAKRLEIQLQVLRRTGAHACMLKRSLAWRPGDSRLAITAESPQASSLMWIKGAISAAALAAPERITDEARVAAFDLPRLQLKVCVSSDDSFEATWAGASARFEADRCDAVVDELAKRLPTAMARPRVRSAEVRRGAPAGEVLVLTPIKDGRRFLPRYFELIDRLDAGGAPLSIAFIEGDSRDGTYEALEAQLAAARHRFARVVLLQQHDGLEIRGSRRVAAVQRERRAAIARARNRLLAGALGDAEWALWLDVDVVDYPSDLLRRLRAADKDIVAAHCVHASGGTFDLNTFVFANGATRGDPAYLVDGLSQPPRGVGRRYLEDFADEELVRVDSVGGAALLVRAQLHRDGLNFPAFSYGGYIETEGLAMMASDQGYECWALPQLRITHADVWDDEALASADATAASAARRAG
jgi:hypothetical protein